MAKSAKTSTSTNGNGDGNSTATSAFQDGRRKMSSMTHQAGRRLSDNPVAALAGGFAIGALVGAAIPASTRERRALQPLGHKVSDTARTAARHAAETGRDKLNQLTGEVVTQVGSKVVDAVAPPKEEGASA